MRIILLVFFCSLSITASAQWWKLKKAEARPAPIQKAEMHWPTDFIVAGSLPNPRIHGASTVLRSAFNLEINEQSVMKTAQHNMRFRIYDQASYNFSDLAELYVQQNRFSEAKWYFLQSSYLSRQQNNNKLTISNLIKLAKVKTEIGDLALAHQDLLEARNIAASCGWLVEVIRVEKKLNEMQHSRYASLRSDIRYAELVEKK